jgi:chemotaxis protein MotB
MAGAGGGAWKVAYADFVTAMMAFFMVMWLTSQKPAVKQAIAGYFRDPFAIQHGCETGGADKVAPRKEEEEHEQEDADALVRSLAPSGNEVDSRFTVIFKGDSAKLDANARRTIDSFAPAVVGKLNRLEIRGHCLRRPLAKESPYKDRWELCYARTQAVSVELKKLGVEPERIRLSQAEGNEPLSSNLAAGEIELNSRVDVILLPDYAEIPWRKSALQQPRPSVVHDVPVPPPHAEAAGH